ncbi:MAG: glutaredoxin 3 [Burkholderiales bacterium]|nr:glutaredoxin 3 [Burkholderiales bacterium]
MAKVIIYGTQWCGYCQSAERLLQRKGVTDIAKIDVDQDQTAFKAMTERTGRRMVPQIFIGDLHVGGFDDLSAMDRSGQLDNLLQQ